MTPEQSPTPDSQALLDLADKAVTWALDNFGGYNTDEVDAGIHYMQARGKDRWSMQAQMDHPECFGCDGTTTTLDGEPCPLCQPEPTPDSQANQNATIFEDEVFFSLEALFGGYVYLWQQDDAGQRAQLTISCSTAVAFARAALAALQPTPDSDYVPDGFVLVPVEPTYEMCKAGDDVIPSRAVLPAARVWSAMLAARPTPADEGKTDDVASNLGAVRGDDVAGVPQLGASSAGLLREAREYVADALEAMEHSDGRDLLTRIDGALKATTPADDAERRERADVAADQWAGAHYDDLTPSLQQQWHVYRAGYLAALVQPRETDARMREAIARVIKGARLSAAFGREFRAGDGRLDDVDLDAADAIIALDGGLRRAVEDIDADYMTSEHHHPGYVLIPTAKFEAIRAALEADRGK